MTTSGRLRDIDQDEALRFDVMNTHRQTYLCEYLEQHLARSAVPP